MFVVCNICCMYIYVVCKTYIYIYIYVNLECLIKSMIYKRFLFLLVEVKIRDYLLELVTSISC